MRAASEFPIEIWEDILDTVMSDTLLLSTNPFDSLWDFRSVVKEWLYPVNDTISTPNYWTVREQPAMREFRQTREILRLVCRFWKHYMDSYRIESLYARLYIPTRPGEVSSSRDILSAKRIEVIKSFYISFSIEQSTLSEALVMEKVFAAEILIDISGVVTERVLPHYYQVFPHLSALHIYLSRFQSNLNSSLGLEDTLSKLVSLTCLSLEVYGTADFPIDRLELPKLTTLIILGNRYAGKISFKDWRLLSLRHLQITGVEHGRLQNSSLDIMVSQSSQLKTFLMKPFVSSHKHRCKCAGCSLVAVR
jgi:hypothetical protein